jgi:putative flippase GtrA
MQSKSHSFIESIVNVLVGYSVAVASQIVIFPMFGVDIPLASNLIMALWFTVISVVRSYILRRFFTKRTELGGYASAGQKKGS